MDPEELNWGKHGKRGVYNNIITTHHLPVYIYPEYALSIWMRQTGNIAHMYVSESGQLNDIDKKMIM